MSGPCPRPECGDEVHTDGWGVPVRCPHADAVTVSVHLTREQLQPIASAIHRREAYAQAGAGFLLPPFAPCPTCGGQPTGLLVNSDGPAHFPEDRVGFGFRPCGHNFTADGEDLYRAYAQARRETP